ncbi:MAG: site-2 protease family protein [Candidatus Zixiibacteriota bacterium]
MMELNLDKNYGVISKLVEDLFEIGAIYQHKDNLIINLSPRFDLVHSVKILKDRLTLAGYKFTIDNQEEQLLLTLKPKPKFHIPVLNIILFVLTLITVYFVPVYFKQSASSFTEAFSATLTALSHGAGIEFTLALISILFVHEMGHYIASRRRNIITSWPYFIPAPNLIGTFGAIIKSKSPFWNRRDLIEVGAAGPIAGWIVAVGWLWYGLSQSGYFPEESFSFFELGFSLDGESILMKLSTLSLIGAAPDGYYYKLTEAAFAGWVGLLITAINLLPIGQLDGGHILYGLSRKKQYILGTVTMGVLIVLGFGSILWWFYAAFGIIFGVKHPATLNDNKKPGKTAILMGIISLVILILSFTPVPSR